MTRQPTQTERICPVCGKPESEHKDGLFCCPLCGKGVKLAPYASTVEEQKENEKKQPKEWRCAYASCTDEAGCGVEGPLRLRDRQIDGETPEDAWNKRA